MLAIRLQRTGRKGSAQFRMVVQESRRTPTSGNVVYSLGYYNPHSKEVKIEKEKVSFYLSNGAQPSPSVIKLLKKEGVKLPKWTTPPAKKVSKIKNPDKLRKNRPPEEKVEKVEAPVAEAPAEEPTQEAPSGATETNNEPAEVKDEAEAQPAKEEPDSSLEGEAAPTEAAADTSEAKASDDSKEATL